MKPTLALFVALVACHSAEAESEDAAADANAVATDAWPDRVPDSLARAPFDQAHEGIAPAAQTLRVVRGDLESLSPRLRADASAAAQVMITNCPFNRSSVQIPMVMQTVLGRHDDPALSPLKAAVDEQVAVLELLGATALPLPRQGDYLHRDMDGLVTGPQLLAAPDPVGQANVLLVQVSDLVQAYDTATTDRLEAAGDVLGRATHDQWPMKNQLVGFREELERLAGSDLDPALQADIDALVHLLREYMSLSC